MNFLVGNGTQISLITAIKRDRIKGSCMFTLQVSNKSLILLTKMPVPEFSLTLGFHPHLCNCGWGKYHTGCFFYECGHLIKI